MKDSDIKQELERRKSNSTTSTKLASALVCSVARIAGRLRRVHKLSSVTEP